MCATAYNWNPHCFLKFAPRQAPSNTYISILYFNHKFCIYFYIIICRQQIHWKEYCVFSYAVVYTKTQNKQRCWLGRNLLTVWQSFSVLTIQHQPNVIRFWYLFQKKKKSICFNVLMLIPCMNTAILCASEMIVCDIFPSLYFCHIWCTEWLLVHSAEWRNAAL